MSKKKTRKQKEKAQLRRIKQSESAVGRITEKQSEQTIKERINSTVSPTLPTQSTAMLEAKFINIDLKKVVVLIVLFISLLTVLAMTENKYNYLSPLANNLMTFLVK